MRITGVVAFRHVCRATRRYRRMVLGRFRLRPADSRVTLSSSRNAVNFSSARTTKRFPSLVEIPGIAICLAEWRNMVLRCFQDGFLTHVHKYLGFLVTDPVDMLR